MRELSLVMASQNNNYGGIVYRDEEPAIPTPQKDRMELCMQTIYYAFEQIDYELIFVEWNPPPDKESIAEWKFMRHPRVKVIKVPNSFANKVCPERSFHETHAKNIGIRRANSKMILGLNNDCLWLDQFPRSCLSCDSVMIANRPTVYHNVLDVGFDLFRLREFCFKDKNIVHHYDWNANGDFTMMSRDLWYKLKGLSTPRGDQIGAVDMQTVERAETYSGHKRAIYPFSIFHIRHPGAPVGYGRDIISTSIDWGFPDEDFVEISYQGEK